MFVCLFFFLLLLHVFNYVLCYLIKFYQYSLMIFLILSRVRYVAEFRPGDNNIQKEKFVSLDAVLIFN